MKLELLEIAGEVWVAMSEQVRGSIGGLFGQQEPEPFRIRDNRDCREIGNCEIERDRHSQYNSVAAGRPNYSRRERDSVISFLFIYLFFYAISK